MGNFLKGTTGCLPRAIAMASSGGQSHGQSDMGNFYFGEQNSVY